MSGALDVDGKKVCRSMRIRWASTGKTTAWTRVCRGWVVLAYRATEGEPFTVESKGRPSSVQVRS